MTTATTAASLPAGYSDSPADLDPADFGVAITDTDGNSIVIARGLTFRAADDLDDQFVKLLDDHGAHSKVVRNVG